MTDGDEDGAIEHRHRDLRISWTALGRWEECRQKEHLTRSGLGVPSQDGRIFLPGTVADLSMRRWLEQDDPVRGTLPSMAAAVLEERAANPEKPIKWRGSEASDRKAILESVQGGLTRLEPWLWDNVLPYEYEPEARSVGIVGLPHPDGTLHRVELFLAVDIAVRTTAEDGTYRYRLHDLKFTSNESYVSGKTLGQLSFYKLAWAAMMKIPASHIDYLSFVTPLTKVLETPVYPSEDDLRVMITRITDYAQGIWSGYYPPKAKIDSNCLYRCDVRRACPLFAMPRKGSKVSLTEVAEAREWRGPVDE